jgi:hypothetical protein
MENTTEETKNIEITIQDVGILRQAIEVAASRGAFKADEMAVVGATYNRVSAWLNQMQDAIGDGQDEATESSETSEEQGETKND